LAKVKAAERFQPKEYSSISRVETERPTQLVAVKHLKRSRKIGQKNNLETAPKNNPRIKLYQPAAGIGILAFLVGATSSHAIKSVHDFMDYIGFLSSTSLFSIGLLATWQASRTHVEIPSFGRM